MTIMVVGGRFPDRVECRGTSMSGPPSAASCSRFPEGGSRPSWPRHLCLALLGIALLVSACGDGVSGPGGSAARFPEIRNDPLPELEAIDFGLLGGARLAFHRAHNPGQTSGLYILDGATGTATGHLGGTLLSAPVVSPNGQEVAFKSLTPFLSGQPLTAWDVYVARLDGTDLRQVSALPGNEGPPGWTQGGKLLFSHSPDAVVTDLFEQSPVEGPGDRRLVRRFVNEGGDVWSYWDVVPSAAPDGRITAVGMGEANAGLHVLDPDSGAPTRVYEVREAWWPHTAAFSPDGAFIATLEVQGVGIGWGNETRVSVLDISSGEAVVLGTVAALFGTSFGLGTDFSLCWTADGARIVFTATTTGSMSAHVHVVPADGTAPPQRLTHAPDVVDRSVSCLGE